MYTLTPYETFLFSSAFRRDAIAEVMVEGTRDNFFDDKDIELVLHVLRELGVAMKDLKFMKKSLFLYRSQSDGFHTVSKRIDSTNAWSSVSSNSFKGQDANISTGLTLFRTDQDNFQFLTIVSSGTIKDDDYKKCLELFKMGIPCFCIVVKGNPDRMISLFGESHVTSITSEQDIYTKLINKSSKNLFPKVSTGQSSTVGHVTTHENSKGYRASHFIQIHIQSSRRPHNTFVVSYEGIQVPFKQLEVVEDDFFDDISIKVPVPPGQEVTFRVYSIDFPNFVTVHKSSTLTDLYYSPLRGLNLQHPHGRFYRDIFKQRFEEVRQKISLHPMALSYFRTFRICLIGKGGNGKSRYYNSLNSAFSNFKFDVTPSLKFSKSVSRQVDSSVLENTNIEVSDTWGFEIDMDKEDSIVSKYMDLLPKLVNGSARHGFSYDQEQPLNTRATHVDDLAHGVFIVVSAREIEAMKEQVKMLLNTLMKEEKGSNKYPVKPFILITFLDEIIKDLKPEYLYDDYRVRDILEEVSKVFQHDIQLIFPVLTRSKFGELNETHYYSLIAPIYYLLESRTDQRIFDMARKIKNVEVSINKPIGDEVSLTEARAAISKYAPVLQEYEEITKMYSEFKSLKDEFDSL